MAAIRSAAVFGLGLIGGSLARDLAARGVRVAGFDRDAASVRAALEEGVLAEGIGTDFAGTEGADAVVLAVPVSRSAELLRALLPRLGSARVVMDAGSTKRRIVSAASEMGIGGRFVGAHPFAGSHESGWGASREGLFAGARVYLTPTEESSGESVELARSLWEGVGARPEVVPAAWHDAHLAWTSHLPQAAATALALALAEGGISRGELGPGGLDMTRLAGSSPEMWAGILAENADALAPALRSLGGWVEAMRSAVESGDPEEIRRMLEDGRRWFGRG